MSKRAEICRGLMHRIDRGDMVLAMPISWRGTLQQNTGRLHRALEDKASFRIIDIVDSGVPGGGERHRRLRCGLRLQSACARGVASSMHASLVGPARHDLSRLTPEETALYDALKFDHHQPRLRLEQERVGFGWLRDRLVVISSGDDDRQRRARRP